MIWRHVLRNSLLPTITVIATQTGYLIGGLVDRRDALQLQRHRPADLRRGANPRLPAARVGVLVVGLIYMVATIVADALYSVLNPRIRYGGAE